MVIMALLFSDKALVTRRQDPPHLLQQQQLATNPKHDPSHDSSQNYHLPPNSISIGLRFLQSEMNGY
jgi:hypothetical protein